MARLLYGTGMRLMEAVRLRVKDVDFNANQIMVRDGKGAKDRVTMLPQSVRPALQEHLARVKLLHEKDLAAGHGGVYLPGGLERKYPNAHREWAWQYVFPATGLSADPRSRQVRRHHVHETGLQRAVKAALSLAGITKPARQLPFAASFLRDTVAGSRVRHPHGAGFARTQGRFDNDDLHARDAKTGARRAQSAGYDLTSGTI